jgi:hypothetical protein
MIPKPEPTFSRKRVNNLAHSALCLIEMQLLSYDKRNNREEVKAI